MMLIKNNTMAEGEQELGGEWKVEEFKELEMLCNEPDTIWEYNIPGLREAVDILLTNLGQIKNKEEAELYRQRIEYEYIHKGLYSYFIQKNKMYKQWGFDSYEQFCRVVLKHSYETERKFQKAAEVALLLARAKFELLPGTKQQALLLYRARLSPEQLIQFWRELLEHTNGQSPTTNQIREKLSYMGLNDGSNNRIDRNILKQFYLEAERLGFSDVNEYLERLLHVSQVCGRELLVENYDYGQTDKDENISPSEEKTEDRSSPSTSEPPSAAFSENKETEETVESLSKVGIKNQILLKSKDSLAAYMFFKNCCSITGIDSDTVKINLWAENIEQEKNEKTRKSKIKLLWENYEKYRAKIKEAINKLLGQEVEVVAHLGQPL